MGLSQRIAKYGYLPLATATGVVATLAAYIAAAYSRDALTTGEPEGSLWLAFYIVLPGAIFLGGLVTGVLLRGSSLSLSAVFLVALTPGIYQALLVTAAQMISWFGEPDYRLSGALIAGVDAGIAAISFVGVMLGYTLLAGRGRAKR